MKNSKLNIVNDHLQYDHVTLIEPSDNFYIHIAVKVDAPLTPFYIFESAAKKDIIQKCKDLCAHLLTGSYVLQANVFKGLLVPPGKSKFIEENKGDVHIAEFDVAMLIEVDSRDNMQAILNDEIYNEVNQFLKENGKDYHASFASNTRRIGEVDHKRQGVFLFNYFHARDVDQNLEVWNYTAGWFEKETNLDNSNLMLPLDNQKSSYTLINHCRWDSLMDIIPSLIFKKTFNTYVLANFYANNVGAMPILYRLIQ